MICMEMDLNLKNCHGIGKLNTTLDFSKENNFVSLIYAPNGTMKTSFAKTFRDICNDDETNMKNLFSDKDPEYEVNLDGNILTKEEYKDIFFVVETLNEEYDFQNISPLISDKKSKEMYEEIAKEIMKNRDLLTMEIKRISGVTVHNNEDINEVIEKLFVSSFPDKGNTLLDILSNLESDLDSNDNLDVVDIKYNTLFGEKTRLILEDENLIKHIESYSEQLHELLLKSDIFEENNFTNYNADNLVKSINSNNLFKAGHEIKLKDRDVNVKSLKEFKEILKYEKDKIIEDESLKEDFEEIDKKLHKNTDAKALQKIIYNDHSFIQKLRLDNLDTLKKEYWLSILNFKFDEYKNCIDLYNDKKEELLNIRNTAKKEILEWKQVVELFNKRFSIPFILNVTNQDDVILDNKIPQVQFTDENTGKAISLDDLKKIYSTGQKRALYLLNIIYEIQMRKKNNQESILIFDDIADSFDYENKYAIIEYLNDITKEDNFKMILLTHNYDFFRTVKSRLSIETGYFALENLDTKTNSKYLDLKKTDLEGRSNNIFLEIKYRLFDYQKDHKKDDLKLVISLVPFIRNLSEYRKDRKNDKRSYEILTNILHYKGVDITINDIKPIFRQWNIEINKSDKNIQKIILEEAKHLSKNRRNDILLENKLIMSMAIRIIAEKHMINQLKVDTNDIKSNQTRELFRKYKEEYPESKNLKVLEKVNLMTPENIHVNSFMYEPLIDMSDYYLKTLYNEVTEL